MNSSRNNPLNQLSENSEPTIKRDLRVGSQEAVIASAVKTMEGALGSRLAGMVLGRRGLAEMIDELPVSELMERLGSYPTAHPYPDRDKLPEDIAQDFRDGMRQVFVGRDVEMTYTLVEPGEEARTVVAFDWPLEGSQSVAATYQLEGLVNDPKGRRAGAGGGRRAMLAMGLPLAACGRSLSDVIVIGGGGSRRLSHFDYSVFGDCQSVPHDVDLSPHPGERHRQLSRKLTSRRSRAGKAARWAL